MIGGGNGLDAAGVKPRLACKLGQIPAYTDQPAAAAADLQVTAAPNIQDEKAVTKPTEGPYNCDPRNVVKVKAS